MFGANYYGLAYFGQAYGIVLAYALIRAGTMTSPISSRAQSPNLTAAFYFPIQNPYQGGGNAVANRAQAEQPMPDSGTLSNLYFRVTTAPGTGASWVVTLYKNGSPTAMTVTISDSGVEASDTTHTVSYVAGDLLTLETVPSAGTAPVDSGLISWSMDNFSTGQALLTGTTTTNSASADTWLSLQGSIRATTITSMETIAPTNGVIDNLYMSLNGTAGAAKSYTVTLVKNGTDTGLVATVSGASQTLATKLDTDVPVSAGDRLLWRVTPAGTPTVRSVKIGVRFTPTIGGESIQTYSSQSNINSASAKHYLGMGGGSMVSNGTQNNRLHFMSTSYDVKKLYASVDTAPGAGKSWAVAVYAASSDTSVVTSIADAATVATPDTTHSDTVAATTRFGFAWQGTGTPTLAPSQASMVTFRTPTGGDTITFTDAKVATPTKNLSDTITWSDSDVEALTPRPADTITWSDARTITWTILRTAADTITWADTPSLQSVHPAGDTITWTDEAHPTPTVRPADTITLSDARVFTLALAKSDTITWNDLRSDSSNLFFADTIIFSDVHVVTLIYLRNLADSLTFSDSFSYTQIRRSQAYERIPIELSDPIRQRLLIANLGRFNATSSATPVARLTLEEA